MLTAADSPDIIKLIIGISGFRRRLYLIGVLVGTLVLAATSNQAIAQKKRVMVTPFEGDWAETVLAPPLQKAIVRATNSRSVTVISLVEVDEARQLESVEEPEASDYARLAIALRVDAFITGKLDKRGKRWFLIVSVREGSTGEVGDRVLELSLGARSRIDNRKRRRLTRWLAAEIRSVPKVEIPPDDGDDAGDDAGAGDDSTDLVATTEGSDATEGDAPADSATGGEEELGWDDVWASSEGKEVSTSAGAAPGSGQGSAGPALDVSAGAMVTRRKMQFAGAPGSMVELPANYQGPWESVVEGTVEVHPLAFKRANRWYAGLGILGHYETTVSTYATRENLWSRADIGLTYRTRRATSSRPRFTIGAGISRREGKNLVASTDLPPFLFKGVFGLVRGAIPVDRRIKLIASLGYFIAIYEKRDEMRTRFGEHRSGELDARVGFEIRPLDRVYFEVVGRYTSVGFDFSNESVSTARDVHFGGGLAAGTDF